MKNHYFRAILNWPTSVVVPGPSARNILLLWILVAGLTIHYSAPAAETKARQAVPEKSDAEQKLVAILSSNASPAQKDDACQKLKLIGSSLCIPAVAALLSDEQLSHSARHVLESMPQPEAGKALVDALPKTSGTAQMGVIGSLGIRGEPRAVGPLNKVAQSGNSGIKIACAEALGRIGSSEATKVLQALAAQPDPKLHAAAVDGLFRCAERSNSSGRSGRAYAIYERLYNTESSDGVKVAAYRGMIRSSPPVQSMKLVTRAIAGPRSAAQVAALEMARYIQANDATETLARLLPGLESSSQAALVGALEQRGDPIAVPLLLQLVPMARDEARVAILSALGELGNASAVPVLAQFAASGSAAEQATARLALLKLRRGNISEAMVSQLATSGAGVQAELARALGERGDRSALPRLSDLARRGPESARKAAVKGMGTLVGEAELADLVQLVLEAEDPGVRAQAAEAVNNACQRLVLRRGNLNVKPLVQGAVSGPKAARIALFPVCSGLINPEVRLALRAGVEDPDREVSNAARRAVCEAIDPELVEDVLTLARTSKEPNIQSLAVSGGVRLLTQEETVKFSRGQRISSLRVLLGAAQRPEDKRLVLAGLGEMPELEALQAIEPFLEDNNLNKEAALATAKICGVLQGEAARESMPVLQKAVQLAPDDATRHSLEAALKQIQDNLDYITDWLVAGPFKQEGKDFAALFDTVFPPETDNTQGIEWKPIKAATDPKRPFVLDLLGLLGGEQSVAYARTWVHTEKDQAALLQLGSDDGVKVWVNDQQVYALNTARPLQPGSDSVNVNLHSGWNMLLLKITQNNLGWEFCARLLAPDGSHLEGLQVQASPKATAASKE